MTNANVVDLHREVSLTLLKGSRGLAVRTPRGQKEPGHFRWDPRANNKESSEKTIYALERNDDNIGIHLFGKVVDVDIDTDNPLLVAALDYFLPPTSHIWGRPSRKRSHRLYELTGADESPFDPTVYPFLEAIKKRPDIAFEIRGGELRNGQYSLLPGSIHPSGEAYQWENVASARSTPVNVDLHSILTAARFAATAALISPHWVEGQRNQLCMAFSGFLHRAASHSEDLGASGEFLFDRDHAKLLLEGVMKLADDDPADYGMRIRTFDQTWDKADKGESVRGATFLQELVGDPDLVHILYTLLVDSPDMREFDEFMERYAIRNNTSNIIDRLRVGARNVKSIMTVADFRNSNMHRNIRTASGDLRAMANMLLVSKRALRVDGLVFMPGQEDIVERDGCKFINQWRGFAIPPYEGSVSADDVRIFTDYVTNIIADGSLEAAHWVLSWCADIFQDPGNKPGTALVLVGKPGSGKTFLSSEVLRRIIGDNHTMQTNSIEAIVGNFNNDSAAMLLVQCDEAINSRRHTDANRLKSLITDRTKRVEPKGVDAYEAEDHARYYFSSNNEKDAVPIIDGQADRRYTVLKVNEAFAYKSSLDETVKHQFWSRLHEWAADKENLAKVHRYLLEYVYDKRIIRRPLDTEARRNMQQSSQRGFDDWLMKIAAYENPLENMSVDSTRPEDCFVKIAGKYMPSMEQWPDLISYRRLEESYDVYKRRRGMASTTPSYNAQQIKNEFTDRGLLPRDALSTRVTISIERFINGRTEKINQQVRVTEMPPKSKILSYLHDTYGYVVQQDSEEHVELATGSGTEGKEPNF